MKAFIDTSALLKKYVAEPGSDKFVSFLQEVSEITVSPITKLEFHAATQRCVNQKLLTSSQAQSIQTQANRDFDYFHIVIWNGSLEKKGIELVKKYALRSLDAIQLAAVVLSGADIFVTSDKFLYTIAGREWKKVKLF